MEEKENFKIGDIVILKSEFERPYMTVRQVEDSKITVDWFDLELRIQSFSFEDKQLKIVESSGDSITPNEHSIN